ncbi:MAG TPA: ABC-2 family transporter protein [Gemmatimonadales bacterium]|nr:ABC-2 family transporter protein [Gemmatimonadales bacterium]
MRYFRLYACFLRFSFSRAMEFRLDFAFRIVMDAVWYVVNFLFFWVLFRHTTILGEWTYDQTLVFMGGVFVSDALHMTIFSNNMWWFPFLINKGDLDFYLVRPVSSLFFVSLREFAANSFVNLLMAVGVLGWALARYPGPLGPGSLILFFACLFVGVFLQYLLNIMFLMPAFWMHTSHGLREMYFSMTETITRPAGIFRGWVGRLLVSVLPFALIVSFPTRTLFEGNPWPVVLHLLGVTAVMFVAMLAMWKSGLRSYGSASS